MGIGSGRHVCAALAVLCALTAIAVSGCGASGGGYEVRAIFDDAGNVTLGEDVRVAGVNVGSVTSLGLTPDHKAVVVLEITDRTFWDFRADASCIIRPQSLLGEVYVQCAPTAPRAAGAPVPPPLAVIGPGDPGAGERLLPVSNTSSPVGLDLIGDIARLPYAQRLTIVINELGAGLAGNGQALAQVVRRADPTLAALDRVLATLAAENGTLARLAGESARAIAPLAASRARFADVIAQSDTVATTAAQHRAALRQTLSALPGFLAQLTPTLRQLAVLSGRANPALANLTAAAPGVDEATTHLAGLADGASTFLTSLGRTAQQGTADIDAAQPTVAQLSTLAGAAAPLSRDAAALLRSVQKQGGLADLLDLIFRASLATNGYDALGHYVRAFLLIQAPCFNYQITTTPSCSANFRSAAATGASTARAASASPAPPLLDYLLGN